MNINQNNIQRQQPTTANWQQSPSFQSVEANFTYVAYQAITSSQLFLKKNLITFINNIKQSITSVIKFCLTIKGLSKNELIFNSKDLVLRSGRFLRNRQNFITHEAAFRQVLYFKLKFQQEIQNEY